MVSWISLQKYRAATEQPDTGKLLLAAALLTFIAGAGGWFLGTGISHFVGPVSPLARAGQGGSAAVDVITGDSSITVLPPILTIMGGNPKIWVRMESALVARPKEKITPEMAADISGDFLACLRAISYERIKGPTGFMYLREELLERAGIRSGGKVARVLISGLVIE